MAETAPTPVAANAIAAGTATRPHEPGLLRRLGASTASLGWWVAGLAMGALLAVLLVPQLQPVAGVPATEQAAMEKLVRDTIMANPDIIPEAINRLQEREVEKLLASNREAIETPFAGAWTGNPKGDVVLVEFFDFNCPYCKQSTKDVEKLLANDPGVKVVFRDMPVLGPESERFAMAALSAAQQGKYPQFYRAAFSGQGPLSEKRLIAAVRAAGLSEKAVAADLNNKALQQQVQQNLGLARALGLTGTPSYVVGNQILSGAVGYDALKEAVDKARKTAENSEGKTAA